MRKSFFLLLAAAFIALPAQAQRTKTIIPETDDDSRRGEMARAAAERAGQRFSDADANGDGLLTKEELSAKSAYMAENFARYDVDTDGSLTWEEFVGHDRWERPAAKK